MIFSTKTSVNERLAKPCSEGMLCCVALGTAASSFSWFPKVGRQDHTQDEKTRAFEIDWLEQQRAELVMKEGYLDARLHEVQFLLGREVDAFYGWNIASNRLGTAISHVSETFDTSQSQGAQVLSRNYLGSEYGYPLGYPWDKKRFSRRLENVRLTLIEIGFGRIQ